MPGANRQIPRFISGSRRTPLSARVMNEIVDALNVLMRMEGRDGIEIFKADGNWIISGSGATTQGNEPGTGSGTLNWRGEWDAETEYVVGDVVIRKTASDIAAGWTAGTYVCLKDIDDGAPAPADPPDGEYWDLFSKGYWQRLVFRDATEPTTNYTDIDSGTAQHSHELTVGGVAEEGKVQVTAADCNGRTLRIYEDEVCVDGVSRYMLHIRSDFYDK